MSTILSTTMATLSTTMDISIRLNQRVFIFTIFPYYLMISDVNFVSIIGVLRMH